MVSDTHHEKDGRNRNAKAHTYYSGRRAKGQEELQEASDAVEEVVFAYQVLAERKL